MFVYAPALLLEGSASDIITTTIASAIGVIALAAGIGGYLARSATRLERVALLAAGVLLVVPGLVSDALGLLLLAGVWAKQRYVGLRSRGGQPGTAVVEK